MPNGSRIVLRVAAEADIPTPDTDQTAMFMDSDAGNAPAYKDDGGVVHALTGADAPALTYFDHGSTGSTETVDWSAADVQRLVANAATVTISYSNEPSAGTPGIIQLWLEQDGTGGRDWAFPVATVWGDAGEPDWTTRGPNDVDLVTLETVDGGTVVVATLAGRAGLDGATGAAGAVGGAVTIPYTFSTTTTDSDPGNGILRLSNATQTSAVTIRADNLASDGTDWSAILATLADASNTVKGHIRLFKASDPTKWLLYTVSAVATPSGYKNITVANVAGSSSSPFSNSDAIYLEFTRSGDQGSTVGAGTLTTVEEVDGSPTDSAVTKLVFPNGTLGIASHVATYTPAAVTAPTQTDAAVATSQTQVGNNSWADLSTAGPAVTVTVPASGKVKVTLACAMSDSNVSGYMSMGFAISGASTVAAGTSGRTLDLGGDGISKVGQLVHGATWMVSGLTPGSTTFTAKYNQFGTAGTATYASRYILVETLP